MILHLKAKHFKGTDYDSNCACAISKAYTEITGNKCYEHVDDLKDDITGERFLHDNYSYEKFQYDYFNAFKANYDDTVVRTLELIIHWRNT